MNTVLEQPQRRRFMAQLSAGALCVGVWPAWASASEGGTAPSGPPQPQNFIRIGRDSIVTIVVKQLDMGQGSATGLATLAAEELDADWAQVRYEFAPADASRYANRKLGVQGVGSSTSVPDSWMQMREAGAAARAMLVGAAAAQWGVSTDRVRVQRGIVSEIGGQRTARFGDLAEAAARQPIPEKVELKKPADFKLMGRAGAVKRLDSRSKSEGREVFGLDVRLPGQRYAVLARPPRFGAKLKAVDATAARSVPGVQQVVETPYGVAVVAADTWAALQGRRALRTEWDFSGAEMRSSAEMFDAFRQRAAQPGVTVNQRGDAAARLSGLKRVVEADYEFPFLAHAPMEPLNITVELREDGATLHTGCQFQTVDQGAAASVFGFKPEQVTIKTYMAGGSFGRRANPSADYILEAATLAKALGPGAPVQLVWTRTDDLHGGYYRSMFLHRVRAGLDDSGRIAGWDHRIVGHSIADGTPFAPYMIKDGVDFSSSEGASENAYGVPDFRCGLSSVPKTVPVLWWRSVGHSHSAYVVETLMDELARAAGQDPVSFRLAHLKADSRRARALRLAARHAGWARPLPKGWGRGVAVHESFDAVTAHVAEVALGPGNTLSLKRIVCVIDCGFAINPDVVKAQMEGGVAFALSAMLFGEISLKEGVVEQNNFDGYPLVRISQMPKVEVHIVESAEAPIGAGEPPVPSVGPAVANGIAAAGGPRLRQLPWTRHGIQV